MAKLLSNLAPLIEGDPFAPVAIEGKLQKTFRLLGPQGLTAMATAGIDMAAWDALAKACGLPLASLLGGEPRGVPAYNSCGLGVIGAERAAEEALELVAPGFGAVKVRLGYPEIKTDVEVVRAVKASVGEDVVLMSDYNQSLSVVEAERRGAALEGEGLYWIEEPTRADDYSGHASARGIRRPTRSVEIPKSLTPKGVTYEPQPATDRPRSGRSRGRGADAPTLEDRQRRGRHSSDGPCRPPHRGRVHRE